MVVRVPGIESLARNPDALEGALAPAQISDAGAAALGNAYQTLGNSISEMGQQWQKSKDASAASTLELETLKATEAAKEAARTGAGPGGENYTKIFMDHMGKFQQSPEYLNSINSMSGLARQKTEQSMNYNITKWGFAAQDTERTQKTTFESDKLDNDAKTDAGYIRANPGWYEERLQERMAAIDAQQKAGVLTATQAETKRISIGRELNDAKVNAGRKLHPEAFLDFIGGRTTALQQQVPGAVPGVQGAPGLPQAFAAPEPADAAKGGFAAPPAPGGAGFSVSQEDVPAAPAQAAPPAGTFAAPPDTKGATAPSISSPLGTTGEHAAAPRVGGAARPLPMTTALPRNVTTAYNHLASKGLSAHQIAGVIGNLRGESQDLDPNAIRRNDNKKSTIHPDSIGIGQWNDTRAIELKQFAQAQGKQWNDLGVQLDFMLHELKTSEKGPGAALAAAKDSRQATAAMIMFERPVGGVAGSIDKRHGYARQIEGIAGTTEGRAVGEAPPPNPNAVTLPDGQQVISSVTPMVIAQKYLGAREREHAGVLSEAFRRMGGQNIDPRSTAWCAAFANAMLGASGVKGTGSLAAKSFLGYGQATNDPKIGDIVVLSRGARNGPYGHVGFFAGWGDESRRTVKLLGGNQGDAVSVSAFDSTKILGMRVPPVAGAATVGGATAGPGVSPAGAILSGGTPPVGVSPGLNSLPRFGAASQPSFKFAATKSDGTPTEVEITMHDIARMGSEKVGTMIDGAREQMRVGLVDEVDNEVANLEAGVGSDKILDLQSRVGIAFTGEARRRQLERLENAGRVGEGVRALDGQNGSPPIPFHLRDDALDAVKPIPGTPKYGDRLKNWQKIKQASDKAKTEADADPVKYTVNMSKTVQAAAARLAEARASGLPPDQLKAAQEQFYDTLLEEQTIRGIEPGKQRFASKGKMEDDARLLTDPNIQENTGALKQKIDEIEARYGKHTQTYLSHLIDHGVDPSYVAMQSITSANVRGKLLEAIALDKTPNSDFKKGLEASTNKIAKAVNEASANFQSSLPSGAQKDNITLKTGVHRAVTLLTYLNMRNGEKDEKKAAEQAFKDVMGGGYEFAAGRVEGKSVRIPIKTAPNSKGVNAEDAAEIKQAIGGFGNVIDNITYRLIPPEGMSGVTLRANQEQYAGILKASGYLLTNRDESGVRLHDPGGGVVPLMPAGGGKGEEEANWTWQQMKDRPDRAASPSALPSPLEERFLHGRHLTEAPEGAATVELPGLPDLTAVPGMAAGAMAASGLAEGGVGGAPNVLSGQHLSGEALQGQPVTAEPGLPARWPRPDEIPIGEQPDFLVGQHLQQQGATPPPEEAPAPGRATPRAGAQAGKPQPQHERKVPGMVEPGNIALDSRAILLNDDATISTIKSFSININDEEVLLPSIDPSGKRMTVKQAEDRYLETGEHLGKFKTSKAADDYAKALSKQMGERVAAEAEAKYRAKRAPVNFVYGEHLAEMIDRDDPERLAREQAAVTPPQTPNQLKDFLSGEHLEQLFQNPQVQALLEQMSVKPIKPTKQPRVNTAAQAGEPGGKKKKRTRGGKPLSDQEQQMIDYLSGQNLQ